MTMLDIEDDEAADDQRRRHGERIEEIGLEKIRDKNADDGGGKEGHERVDDEALLDGLRKETAEHPDDPHPVVPADRKDRPRLNGDDERVRRRIRESHEVRRHDQMPSRTHRKEFSEAFDDAEEGGLQQIKPVEH